jgi:NAD(P) transhydrogenase subunit beta
MTNLLKWTKSTADFPQCDVALVIGANDVVNPAARHDKSSPHLRHADHRTPISAKTVMAIKRSMNPGSRASITNCTPPTTVIMLFGDAKTVVAGVAKELADAAKSN